MKTPHSPASPHAVDRGGNRPGGGADGEGGRAPPPLSLAGRYRETPSPHKPDPGHDATVPGGLPVATPEMPSWKI